MISSPVTRRPSSVILFLPLLLTAYCLLLTPSAALDLGKVETLMNTLEKKIEEAGGTKERSKRTMTGGVRAAQQKEAVRLYWRGKPKRAPEAPPKAAEDLERARKILALLRERKTVEARDEIESFAKAFPESPHRVELESISREIGAE